MPAKRSAMRKIKEVLRLKFEAKLSHEKIAAATGMSKGAVRNTVQRAVQKGLGWLLRETVKHGPPTTPAYIRQIRGRASRLVLRTACETLSPAVRKRILAA